MITNAVFTITNTTSNCVLFKIKTNFRKYIRAHPADGIINPHESQQIQVQISASDNTIDLNINNHFYLGKLLIKYVVLNENENAKEILDKWFLINESRKQALQLQCKLKSKCSRLSLENIV